MTAAGITAELAGSIDARRSLWFPELPKRWSWNRARRRGWQFKRDWLRRFGAIWSRLNHTGATRSFGAAEVGVSCSAARQTGAGTATDRAIKQVSKQFDGSTAHAGRAVLAAAAMRAQTLRIA